MLSLGSLAFATPWLLAALAVLPVLWWLLRITPPSPRLIRFPAVRLLFRLREDEETPAHTPLWLLLLRLLIAALLIVGLAHPLLNPQAAFQRDGPLVLVIDNDWASARRWADRQATLDGLLAQAERQGRPVAVVTTAPQATGEPLGASTLLRAAEARIRVQALRPLPWPADRGAVLAAIAASDFGDNANIIWLSNGLEDDPGGGPDEGKKDNTTAAVSAATALAEHLTGRGTLKVMTDLPGQGARLLRLPESDSRGLAVEVLRAHGRGAETLHVAAAAGDGKVLGRAALELADGATSIQHRLDLPAELRNRVEHLFIETEASAGARIMLDERWRRRPVGIVSGNSSERNQPLLGELYYVERALAPFSDIRKGSVQDLLGRELAVMVLTDAAPVTEDERKAMADWITGGGLLVRFAGPRLAADGDALVPVQLRRGDRTFGGAMSWTRPVLLAPFEAQTPFAGLEAPRDVLITRQVLAEPAADLAAKTWARLEDGTPLVTGASQGKGTLVLVHTTANMAWSNLPIAGLFVDMLRRLVALSSGVAGESGEEALAPLETLDGFGRLGPAPATAVALVESGIAETRPGPGHPPGFYGNDALRRAFNLSPTVPTLRPLAALPAGAELHHYGQSGEVDLRPWLLVAALVLALVDILIGFGMRGLLPLGRGAAASTAAAIAGVFVLLVAPWPGHAEENATGGDAFAIAATTKTRLAYVLTGDAQIDEVSHAGLSGLGRVLFRRTAVELGDPIGVNVASDELAFFPLIYWPVAGGQSGLGPDALRKIGNYLGRGGTVLFDTRDQNQFRVDDRALRRLLRSFSVPPLEPVPPEHVLTKAFYLLQRFPGRWAGGRVWVERQGTQANDGVSPVIVGSNDWAGAWAVDKVGRPMFPVVPGGESQREQAYRFGVNVVMYALTGNYKADQVHLPTILKRLGQ